VKRYGVALSAAKYCDAALGAVRAPRELSARDLLAPWAMQIRTMSGLLAFPLLLAAIAAGCASDSDTEVYDKRSCPPKTTKLISASALCERLSVSPLGSQGFQLDGRSCEIEQEFLTAYRDAFRDASQDGADDSSPADDGGVVDGSGDAASTRDVGTSSGQVGGDASTDASNATTGTKCPTFDRQIVLTCGYICMFGRPFEGFEQPVAAIDGRGFLLACAYTEAASVDAFLILAQELTALGAPEELIMSCVQSANDERRHASIMSAFAGAPTVTLQVEPRPLRSALAIAIENARSGLVEETFSAVLNHVQAQRASSPMLRASLQAIAEDESRHATLSRRIHAFLHDLLTPSEQALVRQEELDTIVKLEDSIRRSGTPSYSADVGLPSHDEQLGLIQEMKTRVWGLPLAA
jgi:hypothetical protein